MREFYMTVSPDCALYRDYFAWSEDYKKVMDIYGRMQKKFSIETTVFCPNKTRFMIVPTPADKERFKCFLLKDGRSFRKSCEISKTWVQEVKDIKFMHKPSPAFYWNVFVGKATSRLFAVGTTLYCSIITEYDFKDFPSWGNQIKGSEFYEVMEGLE